MFKIEITSVDLIDPLSTEIVTSKMESEKSLSSCFTSIIIISFVVAFLFPYFSFSNIYFYIRNKVYDRLTPTKYFTVDSLGNYF